MTSIAIASAESGDVRKNRWLLHVAVIAACALVSLPFLNPVHLPPLATFYEESLALALGLIAILCIGVRRGSALTTLPSISVWAAALSVFLLLQPYWTTVPYSEPAQLAGLYLLWAAGLMLVGSILRVQVDSEGTVVFLATAVLLGALLNAGADWAQVLGLTDSFGGLVPRLYGGRAVGFVSQVNLHANFLVVGATCLAYLWAVRRISVVVASLAGVLLASAIEFSASRAAILELGWLLVFSVWFCRRRRESSTGLRFAAGIFAAVAAVAVAATLNRFDFSVDISDRIAAAGNAIEYNLRLAIYEAAFRTWLNAPFLGVGIGGFTWSHYTTPTPWVGNVPMLPEPYAHDILLQFLAETGLIGTSILVVAVSLWFLRSLRVLSARGSPEQYWAIGIVGIEFVHSMVEFPLWHAHFLGLTALLMGLAETRSVMLRSVAIGRVAVLAVVLIGGTLLASTVKDHHELLLWDLKTNSMMPQGMQDERVSRTQEQREVERLRRSLLAPYVDIGLALSLPISRENLASKISFNERVMHFLPIFPIVQKQIIFLAMAGREREGSVLIENMARLQPSRLGELRDTLSRLPDSELPDDSAVRAKVNSLVLRPGT